MSFLSSSYNVLFQGNIPAAAPAPAAVAPAAPAAKKEYTEAKIQIRQSAGQPLVHSFGVKESLAAVRLYVEMNRSVAESFQVIQLPKHRVQIVVAKCLSKSVKWFIY